ncbi:hypothetical protein LZ198_05990 [Myxococcus sp. K15C18031901]|uniref:hypothetical protein n=1 Tax=Myxococcus dinghuensis TaxID=2906761 RepID=UPI0020A7F1AF|nr:hypothetical protein [Myxococcus dinghuensis]MCP3098426.1 hypothetical protein [Myxococcus dinghuensis]
MAVLLLTACGNSAPANAVPAVATVTHLTGSKCTWFPDVGDLCPTLTMRVYPKEGAPYEATTDARIPQVAASRVQPGAWLNVLVDPAAASRVFVDVPSFSNPPPKPIPDTDAR